MNKEKFEEIITSKGKPCLKPQGPHRGIMFIGTNPSIRSKLIDLWEDPYGEYFGRLLREAGIEPKEIYVSNLYKHPTPENRPLLEEEMEEGWKELLVEIGFVNPTLIVALGSQTRKQFDVKHGEMKNWRAYRVYGLYHPAYINRTRNDDELKVDYINQLKRIKKIWQKKRNSLEINGSEI